VPSPQQESRRSSRSPRAYTDGHPRDAIHYREYKLILRPDRFASPDGLRAFGKLVRQAAGSVDVGLSGHGRPGEERLREVVFYDTPRFHLYEGSCIVRKRTRHRDGWPTGDPEITFKFRHPDMDAAAAVDVRPARVGDYRVKFKEELLPLRDRVGGMRSLFSHTCVLRLPDARSGTVAAQASRAFPALRSLVPRAEAPLDVVQGVHVTELLEEVGMLDFGHGALAKADVALWRPTAIGPAIIGEFSFQVRFERESDLHAKARARADRLFLRLQTAARSWLMLGVTKTVVVYGAGRGAPRHHE
jgi:hypothetical protein